MRIIILPISLSHLMSIMQKTSHNPKVLWHWLAHWDYLTLVQLSLQATLHRIQGTVCEGDRRRCSYNVKMNLTGSREGQGHGDSEVREAKAGKAVDSHRWWLEVFLCWPQLSSLLSVRSHAVIGISRSFIFFQIQLFFSQVQSHMYIESSQSPRPCSVLLLVFQDSHSRLPPDCCLSLLIPIPSSPRVWFLLCRLSTSCALTSLTGQHLDSDLDSIWP